MLKQITYLNNLFNGRHTIVTNSKTTATNDKQNQTHRYQAANSDQLVEFRIDRKWWENIH
jgi:hypothetical protein